MVEHFFKKTPSKVFPVLLDFLWAITKYLHFLIYWVLISLIGRKPNDFRYTSSRTTDWLLLSHCKYQYKYLLSFSHLSYKTVAILEHHLQGFSRRNQSQNLSFFELLIYSIGFICQTTRVQDINVPTFGNRWWRRQTILHKVTHRHMQKQAHAHTQPLTHKSSTDIEQVPRFSFCSARLWSAQIYSRRYFPKLPNRRQFSGTCKATNVDNSTDTRNMCLICNTHETYFLRTTWKAASVKMIKVAD